MLSFADFAKLDIRIGTVVSAEKIAGADKLLKLIVDVGFEKCQIVAGIAEQVTDSSTLVGKQVPVLVNLEPKVFRGHESRGMLLVADDDKPVLLHPAKTVTPGTKIR